MQHRVKLPNYLSVSASIGTPASLQRLHGKKDPKLEYWAVCKGIKIGKICQKFN